jgi:glycosyltransferase involved in cell wall biosynthesis
MLDGLLDRFDVTLLLVGRLTDVQTRSRLDGLLQLPPPRRRRAEGPVRRRIADVWRVLVRREPADVADAVRVRALLAPVLERVADDYDIVIVQHLTLAPLLPRPRRALWVIEAHNLPSTRARHERAQVRGRRQRWLLGREAAIATRFERRVVDAYDGVIVVSTPDADALGLDADHVFPNGVSFDAEPTPIPESRTVLLPATFDYRPNVLGARWFCDEVLPRVQEDVTDVRFALVGRNPVAEVVALAERPGVELHADVPLMAPWMQWARVVVVPLFVGSGTRLKALEAMAAGRPVVGTAIGLEGLGVVDGVHARVADDAETMAQAVSELLRSDSESATLASAARRHVEANFRWDAVSSRLGATLEATAVARAPSETTLR